MKGRLFALATAMGLAIPGGVIAAVFLGPSLIRRA